MKYTNKAQRQAIEKIINQILFFECYDPQGLDKFLEIRENNLKSNILTMTLNNKR